MPSALIIVACLIASSPARCETIPTGISVGNAAACFANAELFAATRLQEGWELKRWTCEGGFLEENQG